MKTYILTKDTTFGKKGERFETNPFDEVNYLLDSQFSTRIFINRHAIQCLLDTGTFVEEGEEKKWEPKEGETYFRVIVDDDGVFVEGRTRGIFKVELGFKTRAEAEAMAEKIRGLFKKAV